MTNGSLMKVKNYCRMLPLEHSAIRLTCIKMIGLENQFSIFLRVAILHRFRVDIKALVVLDHVVFIVYDCSSSYNGELNTKFFLEQVA